MFHKLKKTTKKQHMNIVIEISKQHIENYKKQQKQHMTIVIEISKQHIGNEVQKTSYTILFQLLKFF